MNRYNRPPKIGNVRIKKTQRVLKLPVPPLDTMYSTANRLKTFSNMFSLRDTALLLATNQIRNPACKMIKRLMISRRRNKE